MWRVRYNMNWGLRFPNRYVDVFFTVKPSDSEVVDALASEGHKLDEDWNTPEKSGLVVIEEIIPVF